MNVSSGVITFNPCLQTEKYMSFFQKQLVVHRVKNTAKKEKKEGNTKGSEEEVRKEETRV